MDNQQGPTVQQQGMLLNVMWHLGWEGSLGENGHICMAESLCRPPEAITTLLIGYVPVCAPSLRHVLLLVTP